MNKVSLNTISLNKPLLNSVGEIKKGDSGGGSGGGGSTPIEKPIGVFIYTTDGEFITSDDWDAANNDKAVGVFVNDGEHDFVIAKTYTHYDVRFGGEGVSIDGVLWDDFNYNGVENTNKILSRLLGITDNDGVIGAPACESCVNYIFPNREKGYMPTGPELLLCSNNIEVINEALEKCGGTKFNQYNRYWCSMVSSEYNGAYTVDVKRAMKSVITSRNNSNYTRPFLAL